MHAESDTYLLFDALRKIGLKIHQSLPDALHYPIVHQLEGVRRREVFYDVRRLVDQTISERNIIDYLQSYARSIS